MRVAIVAGASGLVGGHLLRRLLDDPTWDRVLSLGRRSVPVDHEKLEHLIVELADLAALHGLGPADDAFCALGTTIKKAGSQDAFRAVDHDAVVDLARAASDAGARTFVHVTAMGADPGSRLFYNRVKGETERDVAAVGIPCTVALRPSILDGQRTESRPAEQAGLVMMRALSPLLGRYRPTRAEDVAAAMVAEALAMRPGSHVVDARTMSDLAT